MSRPHRAALVAASFAASAFAAGCGSDPSTPAEVDAADPDAAVAAVDAAGIDAFETPCTTPSACAWIEPYEQEIVGKLAGAQPIAAGVTLLHRSSMAERNATRDYLVAELTRMGYTPERHAYGTTGANVLATLAPTTPGGGTIVVGAHFDGVSAGPAAADNATGVAVVLVAARYFANIPDRKHPIVFALFDQEEIGLFGSSKYADKLVADQTTVTAVHCFDMLSFDGDGDKAIELWSPSAAMTTAYQAAGAAAGVPVEPVTFTSSDHQSFLDKGFVATGIGEEFVSNDHTPDYHRATDTYDKINFTYLARATRLGLTVIQTSATAP